MLSNDLISRIRGEYGEMPGLRLTLAQAARLWHLDTPTCQAVFDHLVREQVLFATKEGAYLAFPEPPRVKAGLRPTVPLRHSA